MKKLLGILFFYSILVVLLLPLVVTLLCGGFSKAMPQQAKVLYGTADLAPLKSELEEYVVGVVAAEMPAAFPEEALKAQAVAARTYQVRQMQAAGTKEVLYDVGQAYIDTAEQKKKWGENYPVYASKIRKAVRETAGEIMVYDGEPILAAFHAISAGRTEDAVHVWNSDVPYLKAWTAGKMQKHRSMKRLSFFQNRNWKKNWAVQRYISLAAPMPDMFRKYGWEKKYFPAER